MEEIHEQLKQDYISGLTLSGGDPLHPCNRYQILKLCENVKACFPDKTIWLYTGYTWEQIATISKYNNEMRRLIELLDVVVDGRFEQDKADVNYHWAGSTNQRVIDVPKTLASSEAVLGEVVLHEDK